MLKNLIHFLILICLANAVAAQETKFTIAPDKWNTDSLGNHRAVIKVNNNTPVAKAEIVWRRNDKNPQNKRIIIEDAQTRQKIMNVKADKITNLSGTVYFQPVSGKGIYYVYYMPYKNEGRSNYPKGVYVTPEHTAEQSWLQRINPSVKTNAIVTEMQAIDSLNSFYPMEIIATKKEVAALTAKSKNKSFTVFPEDRLYPIKMMDNLPYRWIKKGISENFKSNADKGENFSFQLGIYALKKISDVSLVFSDLKAANGNIIPASAISCLNNTGTRYDGSPFNAKVNIGADSVQALWCLADIPKNIAAGVYKGTATLTSSESPQIINIEITVSNKEAVNGNIAEPWKQTRLKWLNSTLYQENTLIAPYTRLKVDDKTIHLLGRNLMLNNDGLPQQIQTFFSPEMTDYTTTANNVLTAPVGFLFKGDQLENTALKSERLQFITQNEGTVTWKAISKNDALQMNVSGSLEFDGFVAYTVKMIALKDINLTDISMQIPFAAQASKYLMGLGRKGGFTPDTANWKWQVATKNQDGAWIGNVNEGLQFSLRDERYVRPLNTNFYLQKPLLLPSSWGNENKGGINIKKDGNTTLVTAYSGERTMKQGDTLYYNFNLLITPFHTINTDFQWANRFYHRYNNIDSIKATGATVINIHHATPINPWINYPFIEWRKMKAYIDSAHQAGLKVKIYNTVRELSNHAYETFPMRSLGHEIYSLGKGGGYSWLQEHLDSDYIAAWFVPEIKDAAIVNSGMSRWHNYYVEGMNWLVNNVGIDGLYLDDVAFDRVTMKRVKRALTQDNHPGIIDLHSANQYNKNDGFNNSANLYMEHFPYLNRLWFGEYFDYEKNTPDFFLTEVSGIPFGLMGEMLQDGGNPWRGMVYGMTNRMPWSDNADPRAIWKVWDDFGMQGTKMIGYWSDNCPVKTNTDKVPVTVYKKAGKALLSLASWADADTTIQLQIDWKSLGIDSAKATITAPAIKNFQEEKTFGLHDEIPVAKKRGWLLIIK